MSVPLLDLQAQYRGMKDDVEAAVGRVLASQRFILGEEVEALERELAVYVGVAAAVGVASGTDAILLALRAAGLKPGDEVIVPTFTFFATAGAVVNAGCRPVFADIEPEGFNLDPRAAEELVGPRTRALIAVHLFGQCADLPALREIAERRGLLLIEDAAQAVGAVMGDRMAGAWGAAGCFSFFPSKNLGGFGDGGMITTGDRALESRARSLRVHGQSETYLHREVGFNSRLDALQAAVLRVKLPRLEGWTEARRRNAGRYAARLREIGIAGEGPDAPIGLPRELPGRRHVFNQFVIRTQRRDELRAFLAGRGIGTAVYYPRALHHQECFADLGQAAVPRPVAEAACREVLALPVYPELGEGEQDEVVAALAAFFGAQP